jgi:hypothetical protein
MWTAREKVFADIDEINQYLKNIDFFHDYKLGNVQFDKSAKNIFIEDCSENALVWDFSFENVSEFEIKIDAVLASYVDEIRINNKLFELDLTNGYISFRADGLKLGIPSN